MNFGYICCRNACVYKMCKTTCLRDTDCNWFFGERCNYRLQRCTPCFNCTKRTPPKRCSRTADCGGSRMCCRSYCESYCEESLRSCLKDWDCGDREFCKHTNNGGLCVKETVKGESLSSLWIAFGVLILLIFFISWILFITKRGRGAEKERTEIVLEMYSRRRSSSSTSSHSCKSTSSSDGPQPKTFRSAKSKRRIRKHRIKIRRQKMPGNSPTGPSTQRNQPCNGCHTVTMNGKLGTLPVTVQCNGK